MGPLLGITLRQNGPPKLSKVTFCLIFHPSNKHAFFKNFLRSLWDPLQAVLGPFWIHFGKVSEALGRFWRGVEALGDSCGKGFDALGGPCGCVFRGPGRPIWGGFEGAGRHIWKRFGGGHSGDLSDLKYLKIIGKPWRALEILQDPQSSLPKEREITLILGVSSRKPSRSTPRKSGVTGSLQHPPSSEFAPEAFPGSLVSGKHTQP